MTVTLKELKLAIVQGDDEVASQKAAEALAEGLSPIAVMEEAVVAGIQEAGRLWSENRYFLPDVILSAGAFKAAMTVLQPKLSQASGAKYGRIVIGVVEGDMHDLGKAIVTAMLTGAGFEVIDLGVDVPMRTFIEKTRELKPDILGLGAYMTTTMLQMKDIIEELQAAGLRKQVKVMVGGVPTSEQFAQEIGADACGKDALDTVVKAQQLMEAH